MIRLVLVALLWGAVLGCSILPSSGPVPDLYTLTATPSTGLEAVEWPLAIEEPVPTGGLGTDRIAVRPSPLELQYFSKVRWAERVPRMIQTLLIQSFQDSGAFPAVTRQPIGLHRGHSLRTELRAFEVEKFAKGQAPLVRVAITAQLVTCRAKRSWPRKPGRPAGSPRVPRWSRRGRLRRSAGRRGGGDVGVGGRPEGAVRLRGVTMGTARAWGVAPGCDVFGPLALEIPFRRAEGPVPYQPGATAQASGPRALSSLVIRLPLRPQQGPRRR